MKLLQIREVAINQFSGVPLVDLTLPVTLRLRTCAKDRGVTQILEPRMPPTAFPANSWTLRPNEILAKLLKKELLKINDALETADVRALCESCVAAMRLMTLDAPFIEIEITNEMNRQLPLNRASWSFRFGETELRATPHEQLPSTILPQRFYVGLAGARCWHYVDFREQPYIRKPCLKEENQRSIALEGTPVSNGWSRTSDIRSDLSTNQHEPRFSFQTLRRAAEAWGNARKRREHLRTVLAFEAQQPGGAKQHEKIRKATPGQVYGQQRSTKLWQGLCSLRRRRSALRREMVSLCDCRSNMVPVLEQLSFAELQLCSSIELAVAEGCYAQKKAAEERRSHVLADLSRLFPIECERVGPPAMVSIKGAVGFQDPPEDFSSVSPLMLSRENSYPAGAADWTRVGLLPHRVARAPVGISNVALELVSLVVILTAKYVTVHLGIVPFEAAQPTRLPASAFSRGFTPSQLRPGQLINASKMKTDSNPSIRRFSHPGVATCRQRQNGRAFALLLTSPFWDATLQVPSASSLAEHLPGCLNLERPSTKCHKLEDANLSPFGATVSQLSQVRQRQFLRRLHAFVAAIKQLVCAILGEEACGTLLGTVHDASAFLPAISCLSESLKIWAVGE